QIDADDAGIDGLEDAPHVEVRVREQDGGEVQNGDAASPGVEVALDRPVADGVLLVERRDRHVARSAQVREVNVAPIAKVAERRSVHEHEIGRYGSQDWD